MIVYLALLIAVCLCGAALNQPSVRRRPWPIYGFLLVMLVAVSGLRSVTVGTDAGGYVTTFERTQTFDDMLSSTLEPGFLLLSVAANLLYDNYVAVFILVAVIVNVCFLTLIKKHSVNPAISLFTFVASGMYTFHFNGIRQGIATALFALSLSALLEAKAIRYGAWALGGFAFHRTALVTLPAYVLTSGRTKRWFPLALAGGAILGVLYFQQLLSAGGQIEDRYVEYGEVAEEARGLLVLAFEVGIGVVLWFFERFIRLHRDAYRPLLRMYWLGIAVGLWTTYVGSGGSGLRRLSLYFLVSELLLWPIVFENLRSRASRATFLALFGSVYITFLVLSLNRFSNLLPYALNPVVLRWLW